MMPGGHSGQTLNDRINAARFALAGQGLARAVCKATTEEMIAPKKKHIDYLLTCTDEPNVSIPQMANLLIERTQLSSWVVVFKSLVTVHHLMCLGNERFTQYLASNNCSFQLNNYLDKNLPKGYEMSPFIRKYARYINTKALSYRTVAFDFTRTKRGGENQLRQMGVDKLLKTVPVLQNQIDALLEFDCTASDLTNGVINAAFFLLFKDLIRLFACYNDGIITCLEKYFELTNKKNVRESLEIYKKFLIRMNKVGEFLKVAENVGIDRGEIPDLTKAPSSLLEAMEQHLASIEGKKVTTTTSSTSNGGASSGGKKNEETSVKKAIEEEEQFLNKLKNESTDNVSERHLQEKKVNNPFLSSSTVNSNEDSGLTNSSDSNKKNDVIDLLLDGTGATAPPSQSTNSDDLFSLATNNQTVASGGGAGMMPSNNPFADILSSLNIPTNNNNINSQQQQSSAANNSSSSGNNNFVSSDGFVAAFNASANTNIVKQPDILFEQQRLAKIYKDDNGFDAFGDVLQPQNVSVLRSSSFSSSSSTSLFNNINTNSSVPNNANNSNSLSSVPISSLSSMAAAATGGSAATGTATSSTGIVKGDIDATLANLAQNLDINGLKNSSAYKKGQQFNQSPKSTMKTGTPMSNSFSTMNNNGNNGSAISPQPSPILWSAMQPTPALTAPSMGVSWNVGTLPAMGGGVQWAGGTPTSLVSQTAVKIQPIMPAMMSQPLVMAPNVAVTSNMPLGIHSPQMLPGAIPALPVSVTATTLSNMLAARNNNPSSLGLVVGSGFPMTTTGAAKPQQQSIDPFEAL